LILKAKHNIFLYPFFQFYAAWKIHRNFTTIKIIGEFTEKNLPVLVIANHVSWWDGFWVAYLNQRIFKRKFHFMMLEEQLRKFRFFNYTGGFSIKKSSKSILETIHYTAQLLSDNKNLVLMFPQGGLQSMHQQVFSFENGLEHILKKAQNPVQLIFIVNLVDYLSKPRQNIHSYILEYPGTILSTKELEKNYNEFYRQCIEKQIMMQK
jgi:1-acyl-sn-glycerol-3-phosphate acyltransferase